MAGDVSARVKPESLLRAETNAKSSEPFEFIPGCDGNCRRREVDFRSFSMCDVCVNVTFCDECLQKLRDGNLPFRICNLTHTFLKVYPPQGLVTKGPDGLMVRIGDGRLVGVDEWLSGISRDWLGT
jgi:hypothetical protein